MSAACDPLEIRSATPKEHPTPNTTVRRREVPWKLNGTKVRQAKWMAYGVAASFRQFSFHRSPRKIVSSRADAITRLSEKGVNSTSVKYA